jgi:hypothetical protein
MVILTVSRQSGKSVLARGACGWRLGAADLFGEPQRVLQVANLRETAREIWRPAAVALERSTGAKIRNANGQEAIELHDGSAWRLAAATVDSGVGSGISLAFVDEAWRIAETVVDDAIGPTQAERVCPQLWLVSTAGDGGSGLLRRDRDTALAQLRDPDSADILILEWSAAPEADPDDLDAWRAASPHWTERRRTFLAGRRAVISENAFRTQYLNQWVRGERAWVGASQWRACVDEPFALPPGRLTAAVSDAPGGQAFGYVLAGVEGERVYVTGSAFSSRRAMWAALEAALEGRKATLLYPATFEAHVGIRIPGVTAQRVGTAEQRQGYGPTLAALVDGRLAHDGGEDLTAHVLTATPVTIPDMGTQLSTKHSPAAIHLARAMVWAVGHELRTERRPRAMVVSSRPR